MCHDQSQAPAASVTPATVTATSAPTSSNKTKEIPVDTMKALVKHYESQAIHGQTRTFPITILLGAERVLHRVWQEHQTSSHTPLGLHEILVHRFYDATGNTNPLAQAALDTKGKQKITLDADGAPTLATNEDSVWSPKGLLSILDALDAIQWAWVLIQLGHEVSIVEYLQWWRQLFRSKSSRLEQIKAYWLDAGWKMALELRQGVPFETAAQAIMSDQYSVQAALARDPPAAPKNKPQPPKQTHAMQTTWNQPRNQYQGQKRPQWETRGQPWKKYDQGNYKQDQHKPEKPSNPPDRKLNTSKDDIILLSVFDGIGCARVALEGLRNKFSGTIHYFSWEIDKECCDLTSQHWEVHRRGAFLDENFDQLMQEITKLDPHQQMLALICAGPPCPDYSRILEGTSSSVIPHRRADIHHFEERLQCNATVFDASCFGRVSRPRVWWSDIRWDDEKTISEILGQNISWSKHFGTKKIHAPQTPTEVHLPPQWQAPKCWQQGEVLHCLTTPAPDDGGRPAPRSCKGKLSSSTHARWVAASRQFAPWHYEDNNVFTSPTGEGVTAPIETKESLHELPVGYTAKFSERTRRKMVANGWHIGVARLLIAIILTQLLGQAATTTAPSIEPGRHAVHEGPMAAGTPYTWTTQATLDTKLCAGTVP
eukprot:Skav202984  [mRNA]  locus=scaffold2274:623731:625850:- [translate_table: standard]